MPSVSIVIPCHNSEAFVDRAIQSVLQQSFKGIEIILVDNNSTDGTLSILNRYVEMYPAFIKLLQEPKEGAPFARNRGLAAASAEWLQFLDSDDELLPNKIERQYKAAKEGEVDLVVGNFIVWRESEDESTKQFVRLKAGDPWKALIDSKLGKTSSLLWRKEAVLAAGGWNENMTSSQEYDLLFRMLKNKVRINFVDAAETVHYLRKNSISHSGSKTRTIEILDNYVNLRMSIKNHLVAKGQYTRSLKHAVATSVYFKLAPYQKRLPDYVKAKLDETGLRLPFRLWVGQQIKKAKNWWVNEKIFNISKAS